MVLRQSYPPLAPEGPIDARDTPRVVNQLLEGRMNVGRDLTVLESETFPFAIVDRLVSQQSVVIVQAQNNDALIANFRVSGITDGTFNLTPIIGGAAWTSANIRYVVLG